MDHRRGGSAAERVGLNKHIGRDAEAAMQAADHGNRQFPTAAENVFHTGGAAEEGFQIAPVQPPAFQ